MYIYIYVCVCVCFLFGFQSWQEGVPFKEASISIIILQRVLRWQKHTATATLEDEAVAPACRRHTLERGGGTGLCHLGGGGPVLPMGVLCARSVVVRHPDNRSGQLRVDHSTWASPSGCSLSCVSQFGFSLWLPSFPASSFWLVSLTAIVAPFLAVAKFSSFCLAICFLLSC